MRRILRFIVGHSREAALIVTVALSMTLIIMENDYRLAIARESVSAVVNVGRVAFSGIYYTLDVWHENHRLRDRNLLYSEKYYARDYIFSENQRLRKMLNLKNRTTELDSSISANVLGHDFDRVVNSMVIDTGRSDGVRKNMAVITPEGMVGRIFDVYQNYSNVQIILDVNSKISARAGDINGILRWEGGGNLRMYGLPWSHIPKVGTKVYSTGLGGVFPGGILIGEVVGGRTGEVEQYASVTVQPSVNFSNVHEVYILRGRETYNVWKDNDGTGKFERPAVE